MKNDGLCGFYCNTPVFPLGIVTDSRTTSSTQHKLLPKLQLTNNYIPVYKLYLRYVEPSLSGVNEKRESNSFCEHTLCECINIFACMIICIE